MDTVELKRLLLANTRFKASECEMNGSAVLLEIDGPQKSAVILIGADTADVNLSDARSGDIQNEHVVYSEWKHQTIHQGLRRKIPPDVCEEILAEVESYSKKNTNPSTEEKAELNKIRERIKELEKDALINRVKALRAEISALNKRRRMIEWGK